MKFEIENAGVWHLNAFIWHLKHQQLVVMILTQVLTLALKHIT